VQHEGDIGRVRAAEICGVCAADCANVGGELEHGEAELDGSIPCVGLSPLGHDQGART
jgi:hypothetical protein